MDYTTLSLAQVLAGLDAVATDTRATFGRLDARQLNWRPDAASSDLAADVVDRFIAQDRELASWLRGLDEERVRHR